MGDKNTKKNKTKTKKLEIYDEPLDELRLENPDYL